MSTDQIFMLEVVVEQIIFPKLPVPQKKQVIVGVTFGELINIEIRTDTMGTIEAVERSSKRKDMDINCGKSVVFMRNPTGLIEALKSSPLEIFVATKLETKPMGRAVLPWDEAFVEMVESAIDSVGYVTPVELRDRCDLFNEDEPAGTIRIYERLTFLGKKIETSIEIIIKPGGGEPGSGGKVHLFKGGSTATTFQCERYGIGSDTEIVPVAPLYTTIDRLFQPKPTKSEHARKSIQSLISSRMGTSSQTSVCPSVFGGFNIEDMLNKSFQLSSSASDTVSLRMKVPDRMFHNLQDLKEMTAETLSSFFLGFLQDLEEEGGLDVEMEPEQLTTEQIERMLCGHPDCPAAKLFQKYGIGPLKNGNGLGGLNKMVDPPITYGLSHCNGRMEEYGPLGTYKRPRCPQECFIPKDKPSTSDSCSDCPVCSAPKKKKPCDCGAKLKGGSIKSLDVQDVTELCNCGPLRLKGGGSIIDSAIADRNCFKEPCNSRPLTLKGGVNDPQTLERFPYYQPLRLKGGGPIDCSAMPNPHYFKKTCNNGPLSFKGLTDSEILNSKISERPLRLKGGGPPCSFDSSVIPDPRNACQDLMEEFNKLLEEYKNALGPCGNATCPYSPNILSTKCQKSCKLNDVSQKSTIDLDMCEPENGEEDENIAACAAPDCPYKRAIITPADKQHKKTQNRPACGNMSCPFVKDKLGLDEDEIVYMPPQPCAGKQCPFQVPGQLPPIHWDCPDPLPPEGQCKNPDCPYVKKSDLLKKYFPQPISPCGSPTCPYAVMPCNYPGCPFNNTEPSPFDPCPPVCPYTEPVPSKLNCTPSTCPFVPLPSAPLCENPNCPYTKTEPQAEPEAKPPEEPKKKPDEDTDDDSDSKNCKGKTCSAFGGGKTCNTCEEILKKLSDVAPKINENAITKHYEIVQPSPDDRKGPQSAPAPSEQGDKGGRQGKGDKGDRQAKGDAGPKKEEKKKKRRRKKGKKRLPYVYDEGTYYPGNKIGHRECIVPKFRVPPDMGWMWNIHTQCMQLRPRRGWKPGAIGRTIAARIDEHRKHLGIRAISTPNVKKSKKRRMMDGDASDCDSIQVKPTLQVKKKDGVVYVTMNPLKDPKTLEDNEDPYMDCTPMQFKIVKNKDKKDDFKLCYCGEGDEQQDDLVSTSSSELDIEFTPPAGIIHPERMRRKKNVCHTDTQYNIEDCCKMPKKSKDSGQGEGKKGKGKKKKGKK